MSDVAPDLFEPIVAWRAWVVAPRWRSVALLSVTRPDEWPGDAWMIARCSGRAGDDVPHTSCGCGIYAARDREHLIKQGYHTGDGHVIGEVALAGKVIPHERGYRAQKATPLRIFVSFLDWHLGARLRATYPRLQVVLDSELAA